MSDNEPKSTPLTALQESIKKWEENTRTEQQAALKFIVEVMKRFDVKGYAVEYSGEGDSGAINWTSLETTPYTEDGHDAFGGNFEETSPELLEKLEPHVLTREDFPEKIRPYRLQGSTAPERTYTVMDALEYAADYLLPSGFEINDGGQGVLLVNAETGEASIEHGSNHIEVNYESISINAGE
jgi:hypothetical protein